MAKHVITEIKFSQDYIICICDWRGPIEDFQVHRKEAPPTNRVYKETKSVFSVRRKPTKDMVIV